MRSAAVIVLIASLSSGVSSSRAWGPLTHEIVDQQAAALLAGETGFAFLRGDRAIAAFIQGALGPDLTFDVKNGGKTDPAVNELFHAPPFARHLIARAQATGSDETLAWALGWRAHQVADEVGNAPDSVVHRNTFLLPLNRGPDGRPVRDAAASACTQLHGVTAGLNKILVDGLVVGLTADGRDYQPHTRMDVLVDAVTSFSGSLTEAFPAASGAIRPRLEKFARDYDGSVAFSRGTARHIAQNARLLRGVGILLAPRGTVAGLEESVRQVVRVLVAEGIPGRPRARPTTAGNVATTPSAAPAHDSQAPPGAAATVTLLGRATGSPTTSDPSAPQAAWVDAGPLAVGLAQRLVPTGIPLPSSAWPSLLQPLRRAALSAAVAALRANWVVDHLDVKKRMMGAFYLTVLEADCTWPRLRDAVRRQVK